jgi:hypothetical protein
VTRHFISQRGVSDPVSFEKCHIPSEICYLDIANQQQQEELGGFLTSVNIEV